MSGIQNAGKKGYLFMVLVIAFLLFCLLLIYLYQRNFTDLPT